MSQKGRSISLLELISEAKDISPDATQKLATTKIYVDSETALLPYDSIEDAKASLAKIHKNNIFFCRKEDNKTLWFDGNGNVLPNAPRNYTLPKLSLTVSKENYYDQNLLFVDPSEIDSNNNLFQNTGAYSSNKRIASKKKSKPDNALYHVKSGIHTKKAARSQELSSEEQEKVNKSLLIEYLISQLGYHVLNATHDTQVVPKVRLLENEDKLYIASRHTFAHNTNDTGTQKKVISLSPNAKDHPQIDLTVTKESLCSCLFSVFLKKQDIPHNVLLHKLPDNTYKTTSIDLNTMSHAWDTSQYYFITYIDTLTRKNSDFFSLECDTEDIEEHMQNLAKTAARIVSLDIHSVMSVALTRFPEYKTYIEEVTENLLEKQQSFRKFVFSLADGSWKYQADYRYVANSRGLYKDGAIISSNNLYWVRCRQWLADHITKEYQKHSISNHGTAHLSTTEIDNVLSYYNNISDYYVTIGNFAQYLPDYFSEQQKSVVKAKTQVLYDKLMDLYKIVNFMQTSSPSVSQKELKKFVTQSLSININTKNKKLTLRMLTYEIMKETKESLRTALKSTVNSKDFLASTPIVGKLLDKLTKDCDNGLEQRMNDLFAKHNFQTKLTDSLQAIGATHNQPTNTMEQCNSWLMTACKNMTTPPSSNTSLQTDKADIDIKKKGIIRSAVSIILGILKTISTLLWCAIKSIFHFIVESVKSIAIFICKVIKFIFVGLYKIIKFCVLHTIVKPIQYLIETLSPQKEITHDSQQKNIADDKEIENKDIDTDLPTDITPLSHIESPNETEQPLSSSSPIAEDILLHNPPQDTSPSSNINQQDPSPVLDNNACAPTKTNASQEQKSV